MSEERVFHFCLIVTGGLSSPVTGEELIDATEALGDYGCTDASVGAHRDGLELIFHRAHASLENAVRSAMDDVEGAGFQVVRMEMERECLAVVG